MFICQKDDVKILEILDVFLVIFDMLYAIEFADFQTIATNIEIYGKLSEQSSLFECLNYWLHHHHFSCDRYETFVLGSTCGVNFLELVLET